MIIISDKKLFSELLKDFPVEENHEEFLKDFCMIPEQFRDTIWGRVMSEPPNEETVNPDKIEEFFLEDLGEIAFSRGKKNRERLYEMYRGGFLCLAHRWKRFKKTEEQEESEIISETEFSICMKKTSKTKIIRKYD